MAIIHAESDDLGQDTEAVFLKLIIQLLQTKATSDIFTINKNRALIFNNGFYISRVLLLILEKRSFNENTSFQINRTA